MKYLKLTIISLLSIFCLSIFSSCLDDGTGQTWEFGDDTEKKEKPRLIWIDAAANFPDFANSKENIARDLALAKEAGFTGVVVDVRPTSGDALFKTTKVDAVKWLGAWLPGGFQKVERTETWDYLQAFIDEGKKQDLKVYAAINTFVGGNGNAIGNEGILYRDASKKDWGTSLLLADGKIQNTIDQKTTGSKFFNPVNEEVQEFILGLLDDLASYEGLEGIFLDRGRFDDLNSDFSPYTREKFEKYLGQQVKNFPTDVMIPGTKAESLPKDLPVHFKKWLEFRVKTIHDFMEKAQRRVKAKNAKMNFGVYVGGWYSTYYGVGVNWASPKFNTSQSYPTWATSDYSKYGYADLMDIMLIGAYAAPDKVYGNTDWTIQGFCLNAKDRIKGDAIVIGGPDVGNEKWATMSDDVVNKAITNSVDAAINASDGYFLFDMIHLKKKDQWKYVKTGIDKYKEKLGQK